MKSIHKNKGIGWIIILALFVLSCSKQLDINTDPNNPTTLSSKVLLPRVQRYVGLSLAMGSGFSTNLSAYMHQMVHYGDADQYGAGANNFYWANGWNYSYRNVLTNANLIISQGENSADLKYVGIAKILKAYTFSVLVDLFGNVPFFEANKLVEGVKYPVYDKGEDIYGQLFILLDESIADLQNTAAMNFASPGNDDIIYKGNVNNWIKAANSLKFKLLVQQRKVKNIQTEVNTLISSNMLINNYAESFMIPFGLNAATDDRNPGFGQYFASQRTMHVSPWLYEIMKGYNVDLFYGIEDPRIPYYIYNQVTTSSPPLANLEYRDGAFVSKYFGSQGPNRAANVQNQVSLFGIFPVGGKYDVNTGGVASAASGTGAVPYRLITHADILFLKAELIQEGVIVGDVVATLESAIKASFVMIDEVVKGTGTTGIPLLANSSVATAYIEKIVTEFTAANPAKKIEIIMTQKWLSSIGACVDQYTDYRRTGYPVLFSPDAIGGIVSPPIGGNGGDNMPSVSVFSNRTFPNSLPYLSSELNLNLNAPAQKTDLSTAKIFWMP